MLQRQLERWRTTVPEIARGARQFTVVALGEARHESSVKKVAHTRFASAKGENQQVVSGTDLGMVVPEAMLVP